MFAENIQNVFECRHCRTEYDWSGCRIGKEGYNVYVYSIGNFPTLRCMEQIRYDVAYHNLNVKIVSVGAGYAYGSLGASHHATEELGMMRTIPNMVICSPGDPVEAQVISTVSANYEGPMYLRLGKAGEVIVHQSLIENLKSVTLSLLLESQMQIKLYWLVAQY